MRRVFFVLIALAFAGPAQADITFNFTYVDVDDGSGFGFDDAAEGATRRATVTAVADYINTVVDHNGSVDIRWNASSNAPGSSTLASMGAFYFENAGTDNGFVFNHATTGLDPIGGFPDGSGSVNFGRTWNSGLGGPAAGEFDLFSVVLHEITHSMGFASLIDETDGSSEITGTYSIFDTLIEDGAGNRLISGGAFVGNVADLTSGDLHLDVGGGNTIELYAPNPFEPGSSVSHIDFGVAGSNVMFPGIASGVSNRTYAEADLQVLSAIGWNVTAAIPEPGTATILCMTGVALLIRRRKR